MPQYSSRELRAVLARLDPRFEFVNRGGKHQWIVYHPDIGGSPRSCPLPDHGGRALSEHVVASVRRRFELSRRQLP